MKYAFVLASLACACSGPRGTDHAAVVKQVAPVMPRSDAPKPILHQTRVAVEAPHAGAIQVLTATPEGDVVLSADELGGVRLWPSLDGTQEPRLVELPQAKELAVGHRGDGFTAVARDEVGGLYVARLDREGRTLSHTTVGFDPAFTGMVMTSVGLVGWRADHHVLLVDGDGAIKGDLATEPQQRIVAVATRAGKALVLLEVAGKPLLRWLTMQPTLAWGAVVEHLDTSVPSVAIALSPDLAHVALVGHDDKVAQVAIYDLATGKAVNSTPVANEELEIAFVNDAFVAISGRESTLQWLSVKVGASLPAPSSPIAPSGRRHLMATGGGRAILAREGELMLVNTLAVQFLGYGTQTLQLATPGPDGTLLVAGDVYPPVLLDAKLRESTRPNLGVTSSDQLAAVQWVDNEHWLVESTRTDAKVKLAIVNGGTGKASVVRDQLPDVHYLAYERSTQLVTLSFGAQAEVAKLDIAAGTLARIGRLQKRSPFDQVSFVPLSPKLARGQQLVEIDIRDKPTVTWFKTAGAAAASTITIDGSYLGTDAAGRVYVWHTAPGGKLEVAIYTDGKHSGTLPTEGAAALWPDPTATLVAEAGARGVTLYKGTTVVWTRPVEGVHEVHWLSDGSLALMHASGIARLDAATGAVTAARCGWDFGLTPAPHPPARPIEPICAQLAR